MRAPKMKPAVKAAFKESVKAAGESRRRERQKTTNKDKETRKMADEHKQDQKQADVKQPEKPEAQPKTEGEKDAKKKDVAPLKNADGEDIPVGAKLKEAQEKAEKDPREKAHLDQLRGSQNSDVTGTLGLGGKSVSSVSAYRHGVVDVTDVLADGVHYYIKTRCGELEIGGVTPDWGSGVRVGGR